MSAPTPDDYLTVEQLAARIHQTKRWVLDHVMPSCPNRLPHHRFAGNRPPVFSPEDVAAIDRMFAVNPAPVAPLAFLDGLDPKLVARSRRILADSRKAAAGPQVIAGQPAQPLAVRRDPALIARGLRILAEAQADITTTQH